jgi:hypothetical protein
MKTANVRSGFESAIGEVEETARFIKHAHAARLKSATLISWNALSHQDKTVAKDFAGAKISSLDTAYRSLYALALFHFEAAIRNLVKAGLTDLLDRCSSCNEVPESLRNHNLTSTGVIFSQYVKKAHIQRTFDVNALAQAIVDTHSGAAPSRWVVDILVFGFQSASSDNIEELLNKVGIPLNWDRLSRSETLRNVVGAGAKAREVSNFCRARIDELIVKRNLIAHEGGASVVVTYEELFLTTKTLRGLCEGFALIIDDFTASI